MTKTVQELYDEFLTADRQWADELYFRFGSEACNLRYTKAGEGAPGTPLNDAYLRFCSTRDAWDAYHSARRA